MKFKPYFLVQKKQKKFDLRYFNGRFMFWMEGDVLLPLLSENIDLGERFNCVVSVALTGEQCNALCKMFVDYPDAQLSGIRTRLCGGERATLKMNPQMSHALLTAIRYIEGLKKPKVSLASQFQFEFETNWKGAEIMCEVFGKSKNEHIKPVVAQLRELIDELQERQARFDDEEIPRGYAGK
ncbi:MAG: hypothetical protein M0R80_23655 [Proteobacteria bacterium]|jgi:hypothetical protein|nr:hypothetical protein [Pseudomonadota bacterium]